MTTRARKKPPVGSVSFVGAGPGDPGLLTVRATELLAAADVVVHDADVPARSAGQCRRPPAAVLVEVGTGDDGAAARARRPGQLAIDAARNGSCSCVCCRATRPLFGGVGEEAAACTKAKVPFEIVPGLSSVTAVPAYAGLPLTTSKDREPCTWSTQTAPTVDWSLHAAGTASRWCSLHARRRTRRGERGPDRRRPFTPGRPRSR